jgi:methionyl-tRNA formyltransferase
MKIVFMGTPEFAVPSLKELAQSEHEIVGVVTGPDRKRGRGQQVRKTAVKKYAEKLDTEILQPQDLKDEDFCKQLRKLNPDVFVVVAFKILPEKVINIPQYGAINLHASLLPKYRGPAPINWAIINGEQESGYTIFQIEKSIDTGDILEQKKVDIGKTDTSQELHDQLAEIGARGLKKTIDKMETGNIEAIPQEDQKATKAPKVNSEMGRLDWTQDAEKIKNLINGLSPYPGAFSFFQGARIKFVRADYRSEDSDKEPGQIAFIENNEMGIQTGRGILLPLELQKAGKKALPIEDFINGFKGKAGDEFSSERA